MNSLKQSYLSSPSNSSFWLILVDDLLREISCSRTAACDFPEGFVQHRLEAIRLRPSVASSAFVDMGLQYSSVMEST